MRTILDSNRGGPARIGCCAIGMLTGITMLFAVPGSAAADGLSLGHGGGLGLGLGGLHAEIGNRSGNQAQDNHAQGGGSRANPRGDGKLGGAAGLGIGAGGMSGNGKGGISDNRLTGDDDAGSAAGKAAHAPDATGSLRGHENVSDVLPAEQVDDQADGAARGAVNLMGHNGNAEHIYDDIPPTEAVSAAPSAFENALGVQGSNAERTTN